MAAFYVIIGIVCLAVIVLLAALVEAAVLLALTEGKEGEE